MSAYVYYIDQVEAPAPGDSAHYTLLGWAKRSPYAGCVRVTLIDEASGSDYSGSTVTRANYETMVADPELSPHIVQLHGPHGSYGIAYVGDLDDQPEALRDAIAALSDYSILDDDAHSEYEHQLEQSEWADWGRGDFRRALTDHLDETDDAWLHEVDRLTDNEVDELWRAGVDAFMGGEGVLFEEGRSVYFPIKRWFVYNPHEENDLGRLSDYDCMPWCAVIGRTRNEVVAGRDDELDTVVSVLVTQLGDLLVELCGYAPEDAMARGTIQFHTDSALTA